MLTHGSASMGVFMQAAKQTVANTRRALSSVSGVEGTTRHKTNLVGVSFEEVKQEVISTGLKPFVANQAWNWIYKRGVTAFDDMHNISLSGRSRLAERFTLSYGQILQASQDEGTRKWSILPTQDTNQQPIESVYIPLSPDEGAVCISSQVACSLTCKFCHTGSMDKRVLRNLEASEIVGQVMIAKHALRDFDAESTSKNHVNNILFMGMGEPLYNYRQVKRALHVLMHPKGLGFSRKRITVSTSGVVPAMKRLGEDFNVNLAVSLHAVRDDLRDEIVPLNKTFNIASVLDACRSYPGMKPSRKVTFEYVMLQGVNDSDADAKELARLIADIPCLVNLIPFNPWPGAPFKCSSEETILRFQSCFSKHAAYHTRCTIRLPKGRKIMAACGQLATSTLLQSAS